MKKGGFEEDAFAEEFIIKQNAECGEAMPELVASDSPLYTYKSGGLKDIWCKYEVLKVFKGCHVRNISINIIASFHFSLYKRHSLQSKYHKNNDILSNDRD